jgi:hypothetical protein
MVLNTQTTEVRTLFLKIVLRSGHGSHFKNKNMQNFDIISIQLFYSFINLTK